MDSVHAFAKLGALIDELARSVLELTHADTKRIVNTGMIVRSDEVSGQVSYIPQGAVMNEAVQVIANLKAEHEELRFMIEICWSDGEVLKELITPKLLAKSEAGPEEELDKLCLTAIQEGKRFLASELSTIVARRRGGGIG